MKDNPTFDFSLDESVRSDYVYTYPPKSAYYDLDPEKARHALEICLGESDEVNLYVHIPFCKKICSFCTLFTVGEGLISHEIYVDALIADILSWASSLRGKKVSSIYFGGGTPSLMRPEFIDSVICAIELASGYSRKNIKEISLECSVDSFDRDKFAGFRSCEINRLSFGIQSFSESELRDAGRGHEAGHALDVIRQCRQMGFENISSDLIYGLKGQTDDSWLDSVRLMCSEGLPSVCIYSAVIRSATSYFKSGYRLVSSETLYKRYDLARKELLKNGYRQDSTVRFSKLDGCSYIQKENHARGKIILGFGAGARSSCRLVETRNGYSTSYRNNVIKNYVSKSMAGKSVIVDGFWMNSSERLRKIIIMNSFELNLRSLHEERELDMLYEYYELFIFLIENEQIELKNGVIRLTETGIKFRDNIVTALFSNDVCDLMLRSQKHRAETGKPQLAPVCPPGRVTPSMCNS